MKKPIFLSFCSSRELFSGHALRHQFHILLTQSIIENTCANLGIRFHQRINARGCPQRGLKINQTPFSRRTLSACRAASSGSLLAAAFLAFCETFFAVYRTVPARLKRNFAFFFALGASRFMHFSRPTTAKSTTLLKSHVSLLACLQAVFVELFLK